MTHGCSPAATAASRWLHALVGPCSHPVVSGASVTQHQNSADNSQMQRTPGNDFAKPLAGHS